MAVKTGAVASRCVGCVHRKAIDDYVDHTFDTHTPAAVSDFPANQQLTAS